MARKQQSKIEVAFADLMQLSIEVTKLALDATPPSADTVTAMADRIRANANELVGAINVAKRVLEMGKPDAGANQSEVA